MFCIFFLDFFINWFIFLIVNLLENFVRSFNIIFKFILENNLILCRLVNFNIVVYIFVLYKLDKIIYLYFLFFDIVFFNFKVKFEVFCLGYKLYELI